MGALPSRGLRVDRAGTLRGYRGGTGVRADGLRGLAGRGRGDPRVSSGLDTIGDPTPASGRYKCRYVTEKQLEIQIQIF